MSNTMKMMGNYIGRPRYPPQLQRQQPAVSKIRDYLFWSIINICIGGLIPGLIALLFSHYTRENKRANNILEARKWSRRALFCNIATTVLGILAICLIIGLAVGLSVSASNSGSSSSSSATTASTPVQCTCTSSSSSFSCTGACLGSCRTATSCSGCNAACTAGVTCTVGSITGSC